MMAEEEEGEEERGGGWVRRGMRIRQMRNRSRKKMEE